MQVLVQRELDRIIQQRSTKDLRATASFVGEILVHAVLSPDDVNHILEHLLTEAAHNSEQHTSALCCLLARVVNAVHASHFIDAFSIIDKLEHVLQGEAVLSSQVRFMLMVSLAFAFSDVIPY